MKPRDPDDDQGHRPSDRDAYLQASEKMILGGVILFGIAVMCWLIYEFLWK